MHELSLFSGAGGGLLGTLLLGWRPVGYVEWDDYCQRVIAQRIRDGILPEAPIFTDVREFVQSGAAAEYRGFADVVSGGFPCQPFSVAGKRAGADDPRNMWPATIATIRAVRPRYAFLENVPGLVTSGYFGTILGDLAESGYNARWRILSAAEVGAPHKRDRLWIVAHAISNNDRWTQPRSTGEEAAVQGEHRSDYSATWQPGGAGAVRRTGHPHAAPVRVQGRTHRQGQEQFGRSSWWEVEPRLDRLADGVAHRVDRLKAAGNGQVPAVAAAAWYLLTEGLSDAN